MQTAYPVLGHTLNHSLEGGTIETPALKSAPVTYAERITAINTFCEFALLKILLMTAASFVQNAFSQKETIEKARAAQAAAASGQKLTEEQQDKKAQTGYVLDSGKYYSSSRGRAGPLAGAGVCPAWAESNWMKGANRGR